MTTEFLPQCPDCGKTFVKGRWIPTPECFKPTEGVKIIERMCDRCDAVNAALGLTDGLKPEQVEQLRKREVI